MSSICIDNGSLNIKVGFQNAEIPYIYYQNQGIKTTLKNLSNIERQYFTGAFSDFFYKGHEIEYPIVNGKIINWDLMEEIWSEVYLQYTLFSKKELLTSHGENRLYFITSLNYTSQCYEKIIKFVFENFNISKLSFGIDSINALYSTGKTTGLVIDSGESFTRVVPIFQNHTDSNKIWQMEWAGRHLTKLIQNKTLTINREKIIDQENLRYLKNNHFFHYIEGAKGQQELITLPDSKQIKLSREKDIFPDKTFKFRGLNDMTLAEGIAWSIEDIELTQKSHLLNNIFPTGGNTMIKNFEQKLNNELKTVLPSNTHYNIIENNNKIGATYLGSHLLTQISEFSETYYLTKKEWDEMGTNILFRKRNFLLLQ